MRTALSPLLFSSKYLPSLGKPVAIRSSSLTFVAVHTQPCQIPSARFGTFQSPEGWRLSDLPRVSEHRSPLIFHLTSDNPYHNLSIEHYILTHSHPTSRILLFYTNRPCVVIGRNQNPWLETDIKRLNAGLEPEGARPLGTGIWGEGGETRPRAPIDLIRRRSGGGTVFHDDGNLNYSVIVPNTKSFKRSTQAEMVVRALAPLAPRYGFRELKVNDRNDIVMKSQDNALQWLKVSGSAYKLTKGRALHHGTLLFSSPNLTSISDLLRSQGRGFIQAKGVESVRSQVGNLAWTPDPHARREVKDAITKAIVQQFWDVYGDGQPRKAGHNEVSLGDDACDSSENPSLANGVAELETDTWLFEGTPRFDFASGVVDGTEVKFQANHGAVVSLTVEQHGKRFVAEEPTLQAVRDSNGYAGKLLTIFDWYSFIGACVKEATRTHVRIPRSLVHRIQAIFPGRNAPLRKVPSSS